MADKGITGLDCLKGKKVAFGAVGSTSKHLAPMQLLKDHGLDPLKDIVAMHIADNVAWEGLRRGDVAAIGTTNTVFLRSHGHEKSIQPGAFRVIVRSPDLPDDVLIAGPHVEKTMVDKVRKAFETHSRQLIAAVLVGQDNQKYEGMKFLDLDVGLLPLPAGLDPNRRLYGSVGDHPGWQRYPLGGGARQPAAWGHTGETPLQRFGARSHASISREHPASTQQDAPPRPASGGRLPAGKHRGRRADEVG
jgi:ABC transporter, phosphonate, periplasmic substrate-binding protein